MTDRTRADAIVVGGGIAGVSAAFHLLRRGCKVTLLERRGIGAEASGGLAGLLTTTADGQVSGPYAALSRAALKATLRVVPDLEEASGVAVELRSTPLLRLALDETTRDMLLTFAGRGEDGETETWLDGAELRRLCPGLSSRAIGAILVPRAHHLTPRRLLDATLAASLRLGLAVHSATEVTGFVRRGRRVLGVTDSAGEDWLADHVILANGTWGGSLLRTLGVDLPVRPVRGQIMTLDASDQPALPFILSPGRGYVVPKPAGRIVVGATHEAAGLQKSMTLLGMSHLARIAGAMPQLLSLPIAETFSGLRPTSPDGMPLLGGLPELDGLTLALGYGGHGVLLANICAEMIASRVGEDAPGPLWGDFQAARILSSAPLPALASGR